MKLSSEIEPQSFVTFIETIFSNSQSAPRTLSYSKFYLAVNICLVHEIRRIRRTGSSYKWKPSHCSYSLPANEGRRTFFSPRRLVEMYGIVYLTASHEN